MVRFAAGGGCLYDPPPMRWLLHGNITPACAAALMRHEQRAHRPEELELAPDAAAEDVCRVAKDKQVEILTTDPGLATAPFEGRGALPRERVMVFLQLEGGDVEQDDAIDRLFARYKRLSPGKLYTVTANRVKLRQLPGAH